MFAQAGFREDYDVICSATVGRLGYSGCAEAYLVRWPDGELAWASRSRVCWPEQVAVYELLRVRAGKGVPRQAAMVWSTRASARLEELACCQPS